MQHKYIILFYILVFFIFTKPGYSQNQAHLLDLRTCTSKNCTSNNYNIVGFYLSDINGTPITNSLLTCTAGVEQSVYITLTYQSNSNSSGAHNVRFFADFIVGETTQFLNYYFGILAPSDSGAGTLTLSNFPVNWICGSEISFVNPLLAWTTNATSDHSLGYNCNDYPGGQCQYQSGLVIESPLAVYFDYSYTCPTANETPVSFANNTNGGRGPYQFLWSFTNASLSTSNEVNPTVHYYGAGSATLETTDANGTVSTYTTSINIPTSLGHTAAVLHQTDGDIPNGAIELTTSSTEDLSYFWTGPNGFTGDEKNISGLSEGIYEVTILDPYGCSSTSAFEIEYYIILPITSDNIHAKLNENKAVDLSWTFPGKQESGHFKIERGINGVTAFRTVGVIAAASELVERRTFFFSDDKLPTYSCSLYYRIKFLPLSGPPYYSSAIKVEIPPVPIERNWIALPNPFQGNRLHLTYLGDPKRLKGLVHIRLSSPTSSFSMELTTKDIHISLEHVIYNFAKGVVIIEVLDGEKVEILKVLKR
nr:hypothetical protein [Cytophagales bacterium]